MGSARPRTNRGNPKMAAVPIAFVRNRRREDRVWKMLCFAGLFTAVWVSGENRRCLIRILLRCSLLSLFCFAFLRHLPVNREFFLGFFFPPCTGQGGGEAVVRTGIARFQLDGSLQRRNSVGKSLCGQ